MAACSAGLVPAALTVGTYASSYNSHAVNHAYAAPYVAAAAPYVAAPAPLAYAAHPAAYAYAGLPAYSAYSAPIIAGRR